jgi:DNA-binding beta-propeller fold protein YncE
MKHAVLVWGAAMILAAGCGESDSASHGDREPSPSDASAAYCHSTNDCPGGTYCNEFGQCVASSRSDETGNVGGADGGTSSLPPEIELHTEPPAIGKRLIYAALTEQDTLVVIDSRDLAVRTVAVGEAPTALRTLPGQDAAVVLNRGSATVSLVRSSDNRTDQVVALPIVRGLNALAMAPDGRHALAYFDLSRAGSAQVGQPLQEVTLLALAEGQERAVNLAVGFRPSDVQFSADGSLAFVITERAVSVVDLDHIDGPMFLPGVSLSRDTLSEDPPGEVQITADGTRALVRIPGQKLLRVVDLTTKAQTDVVLADEPTDIDLTPDGQRVLVVLRGAGQIALIDLDADLNDPDSVETISTGEYVVGQAELTPDGQTAFLFTNASDQEVLIRLTLSTAQLDVVPLKKGVRAVRPAPDSRTALVLHNRVVSEGGASAASAEEVIDRSWGYSLLDLASGFVKLQTTPADLGPSAFASGGASAYLLLDSTTADVRAAELIDLRTFLVERIDLASPPIAVGVVPATDQIYVAQSHALGRVTFIDATNRTKRTLTGFALNGEVIE